MLERGITSTRWRDYVDIVCLASIYDVDDGLPLASAQAVADCRGVHLRLVGPMLAGYGTISQLKWAAWCCREGLGHICDQSVDAQFTATAAVLDPVFARGRAAPRSRSSPYHPLRRIFVTRAAEPERQSAAGLSLNLDSEAHLQRRDALVPFAERQSVTLMKSVERNGSGRSWPPA